MNFHKTFVDCRQVCWQANVSARQAPSRLVKAQGASKDVKSPQRSMWVMKCFQLLCFGVHLSSLCSGYNMKLKPRKFWFCPFSPISHFIFISPTRFCKQWSCVSIIYRGPSRVVKRRAALSRLVRVVKSHQGSLWVIMVHGNNRQLLSWNISNEYSGDSRSS